VRHVQPVVAAEAEEQVVARDPGHGLRLEAEEVSDPVILVNDVVTGAQVGERLERPPDAGVGSRRALAEDLRVREQREAQVPPDESAARRRDGEEQLGLVRQRLARLEDARLDPAEQVRRPERLPAVCEGDDDPIVGSEERRELVLGFREPAGRERRPLRLERVLLSLRQRLELPNRIT
jgi:hypothetical protein